MMKNRKGTPDIMDNLMNGGSVVAASEQENNKAIKQDESIGVALEAQQSPEIEGNHKAIKQEVATNKQAGFKVSNKTTMDAAKEKATFNLSIDTLEALEESWIKLRRKLKGEQRITKTLIVEKAIEIALADLEAKSEMSDLFLRLRD